MAVWPGGYDRLRVDRDLIKERDREARASEAAWMIQQALTLQGDVAIVQPSKMATLDVPISLLGRQCERRNLKVAFDAFNDEMRISRP